MRTLLVHLNKRGRAMGIFDEDGQYFYFRDYRMNVIDGVRLQRARGEESIWEEWVESLLEKTQSMTGYWDSVTTERSLEDALLEYSRNHAFS